LPRGAGRAFSEPDLGAGRDIPAAQQAIMILRCDRRGSDKDEGGGEHLGH
jgi:hypothetical protein